MEAQNKGNGEGALGRPRNSPSSVQKKGFPASEKGPSRRPKSCAGRNILGIFMFRVKGQGRVQGSGCRVHSDTFNTFLMGNVNCSQRRGKPPPIGGGREPQKKLLSPIRLSRVVILAVEVPSGWFQVIRGARPPTHDGHPRRGVQCGAAHRPNPLLLDACRRQKPSEVRVAPHSTRVSRMQGALANLGPDDTEERKVLAALKPRIRRQFLQWRIRLP